MSKPKLILHIGHGKTGTTSLQNFLVKNSSKLIKLGYLYPVTRSPRHNHVLLPAGFIHTKHLVAHEHQVYEGDVNWFKQDYYYFWTALINDIKQYTPHTVILSAEQMFRDFSAISKIELRDFLSDYFSEVTVVAYIRSPLKDYLSRISQQIRTGLNKITPRTRSIRNVIEYYESQFPGQVYLYAFEGSQLVKGDLIYDFVTHNMPDAVKLCVVKKTSDNNVALSWELLQTLRKLRLQVQPTGKVPSISTRMFIARITRSNIHNTKASTKLKPKLIPEVQAYLTRSSIDYLWLRDKYNVVFSDLDYDQINSSSMDEYSGAIELEKIVDLSNIPGIEIDTKWYFERGISYYLSYYAFVFRLRLKRIINLYFRKIISV